MEAQIMSKRNCRLASDASQLLRSCGLSRTTAAVGGSGGTAAADRLLRMLFILLFAVATQSTAATNVRAAIFCDHRKDGGHRFTVHGIWGWGSLQLTTGQRWRC
jgi:hypothetical protein